MVLYIVRLRPPSTIGAYGGCLHNKWLIDPNFEGMKKAVRWATELFYFRGFQQVFEGDYSPPLLPPEAVSGFSPNGRVSLKLPGGIKRLFGNQLYYRYRRRTDPTIRGAQAGWGSWEGPTDQSEDPRSRGGELGSPLLRPHRYYIKFVGLFVGIRFVLLHLGSGLEKKQNRKKNNICPVGSVSRKTTNLRLLSKKHLRVYMALGDSTSNARLCFRARPFMETHGTNANVCEDRPPPRSQS